MGLTTQPFVRYHEDKKEDTFTVKLNSEERLWLERMKLLLNQPKDSTALKQLARISEQVLLDPKITTLANMIAENKRRNKRTNRDTQFE